MIQESEVIVFLVSIGCLIFICLNLQRLKMLPSWRLFLGSFYVLLVGLGLTILEGFIYGDILNLLEHICYAGNAILLSIWGWQVFGRRRPE
jgi:hypothetical protein